MSNAAQQDDPLEAFAARAAYRARLWHAGGISLHDATDDLEADARRFKLDTDEAQAVMAAAFAPFTNQPMTSKNVFDFPEDDTTPRLINPQAENRERADAEARKGNGQGEEQHDFEIPDDDSDVVLLDRRDPMRSARQLVAARFIDDEQRRLLHWHRDTFWLFKSGRYKCADDYIRAEVWKFLETARLDAKGEPPFKPTSSNVSNVIDALDSICYLDGGVDPPAWLDDTGDLPNASELLPCRQRSPAPPDRRTNSANAELFQPRRLRRSIRPRSTGARAMARLPQTIVRRRRETIATLQDWFGYTLAPDTSQQKMLMIVGPTRSGKGTIARVNTGLIGFDSVAPHTDITADYSSGWNRLSAERSPSSPMRVSSGRTDQAIIIERLLSLSGEDGVEVSRKFKKAWTMRLPMRFMLLTNELPRLTDSSSALAKRFIMLVLVHSFYGQENPTLAASLSPNFRAS